MNQAQLKCSEFDFLILSTVDNYDLCRKNACKVMIGLTNANAIIIRYWYKRNMISLDKVCKVLKKLLFVSKVSGLEEDLRR